MEVVFIVVVLLLNEPILSIVLVLLLPDCPLQGCTGYGVSRRPGANRFRRDFWVPPLSFGVRPGGRLVRESDRLHAKLEFGAEADRFRAMLECAGETDLPSTVSESFSKLLEVRSVGRSARVERGQRAEAGFKSSSCRASSSVDSSCDSLSATRVESPSSRVQRVNAALLEIHIHIIHLHACTKIHLRAPCMVCMLHDLFRIQ